MQFELRFTDPARSTGAIVVTVNGTDFVELVGAHERPYAEAEAAPGLAGQYRGLAPDRVVPPSRHFLGEPSWDLYRYGDRIQVLGCECGEPGCWPLVCRIQVSEERVTWLDFEQPYRAARHPARRQWSYAGFGPFEFDRGEYEAALSALTPRPGI